MELTGERRVPASKELVWTALNDPVVLRACIPGCDRLARESDDGMAGGASIPFGPITARYAGRLVFTDVKPPHTMRVAAEAQGEAGFTKSELAIRLTDSGPFTVVSFAIQAAGGGRVAQLGSRVTEAAAKTLVEQFFDRLVVEVGGNPTTEIAAAGPPGVLAAVTNQRLAGGLTGPNGLLARLPAEPYGLPLVAWGGMAICAFLFVMIFGGYATSILNSLF